MLKLIEKILPIFFWGVFVFIVFKIPYPESLTQANFVHIGIFFISIFLALSFTFNFFLKNIAISSSIALGLILLLTLKALDTLNLVTGVLILISVGLLISYFKKAKRKNLTKLPKISKLTSLRRNNK